MANAKAKHFKKKNKQRGRLRQPMICRACGYVTLARTATEGEHHHGCGGEWRALGSRRRT